MNKNDFRTTSSPVLHDLPEAIGRPICGGYDTKVVDFWAESVLSAKSAFDIPHSPCHRHVAIIDEAIRILGRRFVLQDSNLDGYPEPARGTHNVPLIISYNGRILTGLQLRTSCVHNSGNMGAEGDPH